MSAWSTVVLSLGSAAIGAAAALAATSMQLRQARLDREAGERTAWRDRGATVLGPVLGVLDDMEPSAIADRGGRSRQTIENIGRRWWGVRDELLEFGAASPSGRIADCANELVSAVSASWTSMVTLNETLQPDDADRTGRPVDEALLERARTDHERASTLARSLGELIRTQG